MTSPAEQSLPIFEPDRSGPANHWWKCLEDGDLTFQRCRNCNHAQLPPRHQCTECLSSDLSWQKAAGKGQVISWVVYHRAYHPAFETRLPYNVAIVELTEGPRLITNIIVPDHASLRIDMPVHFVPERRFNQAIVQFAPM